nr:hypothetical protein [Tanacetum cinerariifolium]
GGRGSALDLDHVLHLADHPADLGAVLQLRDLVHLVEAEPDQRCALILGAADRRTGLLDLDRCHVRLLRDRFGLRLGNVLVGATAAEQVGDLLAATLRDGLGRGLLAKGLERGADHVVRVGRADRLGHHIGNAERFEDGAHRATCDDAGALRRRAKRHAAGTEVAVTIMMQRATLAERDADHRLLGSCRRLGDGFRHFACLAMTKADPALAVAHDDQRREAEALAALHRLRDAVDVNQLLDQLLAAIVAAGTAATIVTTAVAVAATATVATG